MRISDIIAGSLLVLGLLVMAAYVVVSALQHG
jgi:hypothetical protein